MKLQSMAVIFAIIIIPISLILSAYIGVQIDTANLQQQYDTKLLDATHDAVVAFQLNTLKNNYSTNADSLRRDVKASVNAFFTSLATNMGVPGASSAYITQYIPAVVYTLYDGYYIYSPIEVEYKEGETTKTKYEHALKPYIFYSARYKYDEYDIVVNYSLDNYITVYIYNNNTKETYESRSGYLVYGDIRETSNKEVSYNSIPITDKDAKEYYKDAKEFNDWINEKKLPGGKSIADVVIPRNARDANGNSIKEFENNYSTILRVSDTNDPEKSDSEFNAHKREVMKQSLQSNLNNAIAAYSKHTTVSAEFKMPLISEIDWDKILTNVNVISFMQGLPVGTKMYNNYTIITSTENKQYADKDLIYYINESGDTNYYHKINCEALGNDGQSVKGYRIVTYDLYKYKKDDDQYKNNEEKELVEELGKKFACYECIVEVKNNLSVEEYLNSANTKDNVKKAYYNAIARERWNLHKGAINNVVTEK